MHHLVLWGNCQHFWAAKAQGSRQGWQERRLVRRVGQGVCCVRRDLLRPVEVEGGGKGGTAPTGEQAQEVLTRYPEDRHGEREWRM